MCPCPSPLASRITLGLCAALVVGNAAGCRHNQEASDVGDNGNDDDGSHAKRASTSSNDASEDSTGPSTGGSSGKPTTPVVAVDPALVDVIATALELDLTTHQGSATLTLETDASGASFEVGDLDIATITAAGRPIPYQRDGEHVHVKLPARGRTGPTEIRFEYTFHPRRETEGAYRDLTLTWPYYCGRVFPCQSEPSDGVRFSAKLTGVPKGAQVIYPQRVEADAPPYMFAWTVGAYESIDLGETSAGTHLRVLAPASAMDDARAGTPHLKDAFDFLERTYGEYAYGDDVASVWVDWGDGGFGGMEHHPYWHVAAPDFSGQTVHVHEAAHGWFGNAVRIACWEDFVLSESLASYLAARALEDAGGAPAAAAVWREYQQDLDGLGDGPQAAHGWPSGCGTHDVLKDGIFSVAPYMRGAFFFRALERKIGRPALDASLRRFYLAHKGGAARFQELLDAIAKDSGYNPTKCAESWLRSETRPDSTTCE